MFDLYIELDPDIDKDFNSRPSKTVIQTISQFRIMQPDVISIQMPDSAQLILTS